VIGLALASDRTTNGWTLIVPEMLSGFALIFVAAGRIAVPAGLAFTAGMAAVLIAGDRVLGMGFWMDPALQPVRASILLPVAVTLGGLGLLLFPLLTTGTALCGLSVVAIGILGVLLATNGFGLAQSMGVRPEFVTPLPAAVIPVALGVGVFATHRLRPLPPRSLGYAWAPGAATFLLVTMSFVVWQALVRLQERDLAQLTRSAAATVSGKLLSDLSAIGSIVDLLSRQGSDPARAWTQEAQVLRRTSPAVVSLSFFDANLAPVQQIVMTNAFVVPSELPPEDRYLLASTLRDAHRPVVTPVDRRVEGHPIVRLALARDPAVLDAGYVVAALDVHTLLAEWTSALQDYAVRIEIEGALIASSGSAGTSWDDPAVHRQVLSLPGGTQWTLLVNPSKPLRRSARSNLPDIVLGASLLLALLLGSTLRLARAAASHAMELGVEAEQRRRAEAEVRALNQTLEHRVEQRTEALLRANDDLRQFSAFVAHELRQPLSAMGLWAELLEGGPPPLNDKQRRQLDKIRSAVTRMSRLIESELSLAQMSHGELPKERIDLASLLAEVRADLASALEHADARLETGPLGWLMADPRQLRLLFRNLVESALKHRGDAALVVHVEERDPKDAAHCIIVVRHNGRGFTAETAQRVFTIFNRMPDPPQSGTGIGLAICRRIAERHGGRITASGDPESGAIFTIELPREGIQEDIGAVAS